MERPYATLTFRPDPDSSKRGQVRLRPQASPPDALTKPSHPILLIHGFNNDEEDSRKAYEGFRQMQRILGNLRDEDPVAGGRLIDVYWPGDVGFFSSLNYDDSLFNAKISAGRLADALQDAAAQSGFKQVDIVAHSMGCRLALELIKRLREKNVTGVYIRRAVFLAGAIPTFMLDPVAILRRSLDAAQPEGVLSLFSTDDRVLRYAFPKGQEWSEDDQPGEWRDPTVALGLQYWTHPDPPSVLDQSRVKNAGHSDYWGCDEDTRDCQGKQANLYIKSFLQFPEAGIRETLTHDTGDRVTEPARSTSKERTTPARTVSKSS